MGYTYRKSIRKDSRMTKSEKQDVEALVAMLDQYTQSGDSRIKVQVVEGDGQMVSHEYHHGRCDVGSPWARGAAFDVLEDD